MVTGLWYTNYPNFGSLSWCWRCKEHQCPLSPHLGLWRTLQVPEHIQIKIRMPNTSQEPPASSKAPNQDLRDIDVLCTFKIWMEGHNFQHGCIKEHWQYPIQDQYAKPQSGTSSILQNPKWGLKVHGWSLHLQNQDREPKIKSWVYQRPVTISKSRSRCQTPVRTLCVLWGLKSGL